MAEFANSSETVYGGVITPLVLPLFPNQIPDFDSLEQLLEFQIAGNVDGFWLNGTSGEFYALREEQRVEVIQVAKRCIKGRAKIIAHVGHASTRLVIEHTETILELGVDALALVPPYYIPHSQTELIDHFRTVSHEFNQPLFLYHVPSMCKNSLSYENIVMLAAEGTLIGLKDSAGDLKSFADLVQKTQRMNFCCLNGNSRYLGKGFSVGAHGFAGAIANMLPARCKEAYEAAQHGDEEKVEASQKFINDVFRVLSDLPGKASFTWLNKWVMKELGVIRHDTAFQPFDRLDSVGENYLRTNLMPLARGVISDVKVPA
ncbi:MAG: dihydrodipicolinate synthase family protein [Planctomycetota bacterium]|nr:dihydrodipicolinate synthase family protein [Planctomycetota bacterium]